MHPFSVATAWADDPGDPKRGALDAAWYQGRGVYGGLSAALLLKACATRIRDKQRIPRSLTVHFAAAAEAGPVEISTELVREGSKVSHVTARLVRNELVICFASATFAAARPYPLVYDRTEMPLAPPLDRAPPMTVHPMMPEFTRFFDMRFCVGSPPFSGAERPETGGYIAPREPLICDAALAVAMLDAWPPAAMALSDQMMAAASVDFTVHFAQPLPLANATPNDYYLARVSSRFAKDGYTEELRELWSLDGQYVGQCRQLVALF